MSARDEPPATVPPPVGEEDAYSATTKVGAMPAELMAKLRAEGLLPDEAEPGATAAPSSPPAASAPSTKPPDASRPAVPRPARAVPVLRSSAPPGPNSSAPPPTAPAPDPNPPRTAEVELLAPLEPSGVPRIRLDTPPPPSALSSAPPPATGEPKPAHVVAEAAPAPADEAKAIAGLPESPIAEPAASSGGDAAIAPRRSGRLGVLVVLLAVVLVVAFVVALLSKRG